MPIFSYAQNFEDVLIQRCFRGKWGGVYIDVGAGGPVEHSVTLSLYERGWHGVNIEPLTERHAELVRFRPRDINLNIAIGAVPGERLLHVAEGMDGLSSLNPSNGEAAAALGARVHPRAVPIETLSAVCEAHGVGEVDVLKVDVEGSEGEVLQSLDWRRWRPVLVLVEATAPTTAIPAHEAWEPQLLAHDYRFAHFDGLNRYYARAESPEMLERLTHGPSLWDTFLRYGELGDPDTRWDHPDAAFVRLLAASALAARAALPVDQDVEIWLAPYAESERDAAPTPEEIARTLDAFNGEPAAEGAVTHWSQRTRRAFYTHLCTAPDYAARRARLWRWARGKLALS